LTRRPAAAALTIVRQKVALPAGVVCPYSRAARRAGRAAGASPGQRTFSARRFPPQRPNGALSLGLCVRPDIRPAESSELAAYLRDSALSRHQPRCARHRQRQVQGELHGRYLRSRQSPRTLSIQRLPYHGGPAIAGSQPERASSLHDCRFALPSKAEGTGTVRHPVPTEYPPAFPSGSRAFGLSDTPLRQRVEDGGQSSREEMPSVRYAKARWCAIVSRARLARSRGHRERPARVPGSPDCRSAVMKSRQRQRASSTRRHGSTRKFSGELLPWTGRA
jgi:hypothetical protein